MRRRCSKACRSGGLSVLSLARWGPEGLWRGDTLPAWGCVTPRRIPWQALASRAAAQDTPPAVSCSLGDDGANYPLRSWFASRHEAAKAVSAALKALAHAGEALCTQQGMPQESHAEVYIRGTRELPLFGTMRALEADVQHGNTTGRVRRIGGNPQPACSRPPSRSGNSACMRRYCTPGQRAACIQAVFLVMPSADLLVPVLAEPLRCDGDTTNKRYVICSQNRAGILQPLAAVELFAVLDSLNGTHRYRHPKRFAAQLRGGGT